MSASSSRAIATPSRSTHSPLVAIEHRPPAHLMAEPQRLLDAHARDMGRAIDDQVLWLSPTARRLMPKAEFAGSLVGALPRGGLGVMPSRTYLDLLEELGARADAFDLAFPQADLMFTLAGAPLELSIAQARQQLAVVPASSRAGRGHALQEHCWLDLRPVFVLRHARQAAPLAIAAVQLRGLLIGASVHVHAQLEAVDAGEGGLASEQRILVAHLAGQTLGRWLAEQLDVAGGVQTLYQSWPSGLDPVSRSAQAFAWGYRGTTLTEYRQEQLRHQVRQGQASEREARLAELTLHWSERDRYPAWRQREAREFHDPTLAELGVS